LEVEEDGIPEAGQAESTGGRQDNSSAGVLSSVDRASQPVPSQRSDSSDPDWDIAVLDTAKHVNYLSPVEKSVILEINKVRADPKKYARLYIRPELQYYSGKFYRKPGQARIQTYEGVKAVEECITVLMNLGSAPPLTPEPGLSRAARDLAYEQERTGQTGHTGIDDSTPLTRIRRYGGGHTVTAENLYYGAEQAREIVVQLLIDDGMATRVQRANILNGHFSRAGVSFASHPSYKSVCVITFADAYMSD
jgi:uncharacterized protein YkwD